MHSVPQHPSGQRFVSKRGAHPQHILNEFDMNRYLDALGVGVPDGTPTYVDVGGSGPFRAMGGPKGDAWGSGTSDLDTMQFKPPHTQDVFGNMSEQELGQSFDRYGGQDAFMDALQHLQDASTRNIMQQRVEDIARRVA
jgi:hypothetical protein